MDAVSDNIFIPIWIQLSTQSNIIKTCAQNNSCLLEIYILLFINQWEFFLVKFSLKK